MIQDMAFAVGMGLVTFAMMAGWAAMVAKINATRISRKALYVAGVYCAAMTLFFLVVSMLHLGHRLFAWMRP